MNIKATITQGGRTTAKVTPQQNILVTNYRLNVTDLKLGDLTNVNEGNLPDGAILSYNSSTQVWEARNVIENPNTELNGGFF